MASQTPPRSWPVGEEDLGNGWTVVRYAYADGSAANVAVPTIDLPALDHAVIASYVKRRPPPPPKT